MTARAGELRDLPLLRIVVEWQWAASGVRSKQTVFACHDGGMDPGADVEFAQDVLYVDFDGGLGNAVLARNFLVAGAACDATQDVEFAGRQAVDG